mgnify:CR=1 FL=1
MAGGQEYQLCTDPSKYDTHFEYATKRSPMKRKKILKNIFIGLIVLFILIQAVRPTKNSGVADTDKDITHFVQVPDTIHKIFKTSCYDCHSNHTNYPWYAEIAPSSWWLASHVNKGKAELNFSDFAQYTPRRMKSKLSAIADQVANGEMPLNSYLLLHADARLSKKQIQMITNWTDSAKAEVIRNTAAKKND